MQATFVAANREMDSAQAKIQSQNGFLDSDDDEEDGMFDFQSEHDKKIGAQILMLLTWMSLVRKHLLISPRVKYMLRYFA